MVDKNNNVGRQDCYSLRRRYNLYDCMSARAASVPMRPVATLHRRIPAVEAVLDESACMSTTMNDKVAREKLKDLGYMRSLISRSSIDIPNSAGSSETQI